MHIQAHFNPGSTIGLDKGSNIFLFDPGVILNHSKP